MSSEPSQTPQPEDESKSVSKKAAKKEAVKQEKLRLRQEDALAAATSSLAVEEEDPLASNYGDVPLSELQSKNVADINQWTEVGALNESLKGQQVLVSGRVQTIRPVSKKMAFLVVREQGFTVQCLVQVKPNEVSSQMVKYAAALSRESIVEIVGIVSVPDVAIKAATQQVCGNFGNCFVGDYDFDVIRKCVILVMRRLSCK